METTKYSAKNAIQNNLFFHFLLFVFLSFFLIKPGHTQFAFELGAVSLYKDRGEDQDEKNKNFSPALQGGWQYHSEAGFFIGNWLSTGKFGKANVEIESLAGFGASITENIDLEFGYTHSIYPREGNENSGELFLSLIYQNLSFEIYRGMRSGVNQKNMYYNFDYIHPVDERWALGAGLGYEHYAEKGVTGKIDYRAGAFYEVNKNAQLSLIFAGANHKHAVEDGIRDNRVIAGLNFSF